MGETDQLAPSFWSHSCCMRVCPCTNTGLGAWWKVLAGRRGGRAPAVAAGSGRIHWRAFMPETLEEKRRRVLRSSKGSSSHPRQIVTASSCASKGGSSSGCDCHCASGAGSGRRTAFDTTRPRPGSIRWWRCECRDCISRGGARCRNVMSVECYQQREGICPECSPGAPVKAEGAGPACPGCSLSCAGVRATPACPLCDGMATT